MPVSTRVSSFKLTLSICVIAIQTFFTFASHLTPRTVDLGYARYQTDVSLEDGVVSFLGIRFGESPGGDMRWEAPRKPNFISGISNATSQPNQCYQAGIGLSSSNPLQNRFLLEEDIATSEDCLFLNVHAPLDADENSNLPVIVWIHGGGYDLGSARSYPAQNFVKESGYRVVSVGLQYRLGLFGFLPGRKVKESGALNAGLLDQRLGLEWVQDHISLFGGDPFKVTIWGSSAGAGAVLQHIVSQDGHADQKLFRGAIMSSPFLPFQFRYDDEIPETLYSEVVNRTNCTGTLNTLACLRSADVSILSAANMAITVESFVGTYAFVPVIDGTFIVDRPIEILGRGKVNGHGLLVITNSHEGDIFVNKTVLTPVNYTLAQYVERLFPRIDNREIKKIVDLYSGVNLTLTPLDQAAAIFGDVFITCPAYFALKPFGKMGWKGEFAIPPGTHGLDLSYEFTSFSTPPTYNNTSFQHSFSQSLLSVAISLDPNINISPTLTPEWENWSTNLGEMLFNKTDTGSPDIRPFKTDRDLLKRCRYWESLAAVNSQ